MKKMFMAVIAFMMTISASAQFYIYFSDGTVAKVDSISMVAPEEPEQADPSAGIGVFSVAEGKTVTFSPGNLQYTQSTNTWSFATEQYNIIGTSNIQDNSLSDTIDLFTWGSGNNPMGCATTTFVDWGTNTIDGVIGGTWRTMNQTEWNYLINQRENASNLIGIAQIENINGLIILPDHWINPAGISFKSGFHQNSGSIYYAEQQRYTIQEWKIMESAGAIFIPAAGCRTELEYSGENEHGYLWLPDTPSLMVHFNSKGISTNSKPRPSTGTITFGRGNSVRLVKNLK